MEWNGENQFRKQEQWKMVAKTPMYVLLYGYHQGGASNNKYERNWVAG